MGIIAYGVGVYRHTPEIEQQLSQISKQPVSVVFAPHLAPMGRGLLSTIYVEFEKAPTEEGLSKLYKDFYHRDPYMNLMSGWPEVEGLRGTALVP